MRNSLPIQFHGLILLLLLAFPAGAQPKLYPFLMPGYGFIRYDLNQFELDESNQSYQQLFSKFDQLIRTGSNHINIVHIGGSHIQADIYTHRMRQQLQSFYPGFLGGRGFFFPYPLAGTNSPDNLKITYTGHWVTSKNTQSNPANILGLSGITSVMSDTAATLQIIARFDTAQHYDFSRVKIFYNTAVNSRLPEIVPAHLVKDCVINDSSGYVQYDLVHAIDTLTLYVHQGDSAHAPFQLQGISLETDDPGVTYSSVGVNGARLSSYLRCELLVTQLKALEPDWIIVSIGTNDGNTRQFNAGLFHSEYTTLLSNIRKAMPEAAILITVPNDSYLFKRYINRNTATMREIIFDIARSNGYGVWDFYSVMGGLNSAASWYSNGLMSKDHIHFNKPGYLLNGDLFFNAFLNTWEKHLTNNTAEVITLKK